MPRLKLTFWSGYSKCCILQCLQRQSFQKNSTSRVCIIVLRYFMKITIAKILYNDFRDHDIIWNSGMISIRDLNWNTEYLMLHLECRYFVVHSYSRTIWDCNLWGICRAMLQFVNNNLKTASSPNHNNLNKPVQGKEWNTCSVGQPLHFLQHQFSLLHVTWYKSTY